MKRLQGGKVVDYDPFTPEAHAEEPTTGTFQATSGSPIKVTMVPSGSITEVLEWVGDDPDRADAALKAELSKETPRSTLVDKLS